MQRRSSPQFDAWRLAETAAGDAERAFYERTLQYFRGALPGPPDAAQREQVERLRQEAQLAFRAMLTHLAQQAALERARPQTTKG